MTPKVLNLAPKFSLPIDFVTKTAAILAQRRKGKTYTASLFAEEFVRADIPFVALDPTGAWWGLRASADGKSEGLPVVLLGGSHADVPIGREDGAFAATLVVDHPGYYVIDFSMFESGSAEKQFATDFAKTLYRLKLRGKNFPLHVFVDEAQRFVPQTVRDRKEGDAAMLGAFETLVLRGGLHGIGTTLISQRAAGVNKNVLEQIDVLICLRIMGPNDIDSVDGYIKRYASAEERADFLSSLPMLRLGEAWVYEPGGDPPMLEKVQFRQRRTFNSSATPKPGEQAVVPTKLAAVDIEQVRAMFASSIEEADANDPAKLREEIARQKADLVRLERELRARPAGPAEPTVVEKVVEVEVAPANLREMLRSIELGLEGIERGLDEVAELSRMRRALTGEAKAILDQLPARGKTPARTMQRTELVAKPETPSVRPPKPETLEVPSTGEVKLSLAERKILAVLIARGGQRTKRQLAVQTAYSITGGGFNNALGRLRTLGLISASGDPIELLAVPDGFEAPEGFDLAMPAGGRELLEFWFSQTGKAKLSKAEKSILEVLWEHPDGMAKDDIAAKTGYAPEGGGFNNALGRLRTLELIEGGGRGGGLISLDSAFRV